MIPTHTVVRLQQLAAVRRTFVAWRTAIFGSSIHATAPTTMYVRSRTISASRAAMPSGSEAKEETAEAKAEETSILVVRGGDDASCLDRPRW